MWLGLLARVPLHFTAHHDTTAFPSDERKGIPVVDFWLWLVQLALALAGVFAGLLFVRAAQRGGMGGGMPGCGPRSGCEVVAGSRWAKVGVGGGVPVAGLGLLLYCGLTLATLARLFPVTANWGTMAQMALVTAAVGGALWFTFLMVVVIRRVCKFCMFFHGIGLLLGLMVWRAHAVANPIPMLVGIAGVLALIVHQLAFPAKTYAVTVLGAVTPEAQPQPTSSEDLVLLGGRVRLAMADWPQLGADEARQKVAFLFDITCEECRASYQTLQQAVALRPKELGVLLVPVPLDPACHPLVAAVAKKNASPPHPLEACDLAKLFLAVWHTDREVFREFSHWLMSSRQTPALQVARSRAHQRLGPPLSTTLLTAPLDGHIQKAIRAHQAAGSEKLPQLLLADRLITGRIGAVAEWMKVLALETKPATPDKG
jgi:uncharacterized membrane protein